MHVKFLWHCFDLPKKFSAAALTSLPIHLFQDWKTCQALTNAIELKKRIRSFDINNVNIEQAQKSKNILDHIRVDDVQETSQGAATFYVWVQRSYIYWNPNDYVPIVAYVRTHEGALKLKSWHIVCVFIV